MKNIRLSKRHEKIIHHALTHAIVMTEDAMFESTQTALEKRWNKGKLKEIDEYKEIYALIRKK